MNRYLASLTYFGKILQLIFLHDLKAHNAILLHCCFTRFPKYHIKLPIASRIIALKAHDEDIPQTGSDEFPLTFC